MEDASPESEGEYLRVGRMGERGKGWEGVGGGEEEGEGGRKGGGGEAERRKGGSGKTGIKQNKLPLP